MSVQLKLRIKLPWGEEKIIPFEGREMSIGRGSDCQIKVDDPEVSREHALIRYISPEKLKIVDLGSTNGTFVRGIPVTSESTLTPGTTMKIGETLVTFETEAEYIYERIFVDESALTQFDWHAVISDVPSSASLKHETMDLFHSMFTNSPGLAQIKDILKKLVNIFNASNGFIVLLENGEWASYVTHVDKNRKMYLPVDTVNQAIHTGNPLVISFDGSEGNLAKTGSASAVAMPIRDEKLIWGAVYLDRQKNSPAFQKSEVAVLLKIGKLISQIYDKDRDYYKLQKELSRLRYNKEHWFQVIQSFSGLPLKSQNRKYQQLLFKAMRLAGTDHPILLVGASGSGRKTLAQRIHASSSRKDNPFISVICSEIQRSEVEEELFGLEVPGNDPSHPEKFGIIEMTNGGTLFLKEISALPLSVQGRLAEIIQENRFMRKGGQIPIYTDVRIIASTDVDINRMLSSGSLHPTLYELFKSTTLENPPLKARREDILPLSKYFLRNYLPKNRPLPSFSDETVSLFYRYPWPGNIKELAGIMRYIAAVCDDHSVEIGDLPRSLREVLAPSIDSQEPLRKQMDRLESEIIRNALDRNNRVVTRAAKELGLSESTLRYRMYRLGLSTDRRA